MLQAFAPTDDSSLIVNHINEIKDDNRLTNLEWCTYKENNNHGTKKERARESHIKRNIEKTGYRFIEISGLDGERLFLTCEHDILTLNSLADFILDEYNSRPDVAINHIRECCDGKRQSAYGYRYAWYKGAFENDR